MSVSILLLLLCALWVYLQGCAIAPSLDASERQFQGTSPDGSQSLTQPTEVYERRRLQMVEQQLRSRDIRDEAVLQAMSRVPRHRFVAPALAEFAYDDRPLPIDYEQTISQPYIVAYMTQAADIAPTEKVLEIGTGSGYQAAVLAELAEMVYTVEIVPELAEQASRVLDELNYTNIQVKTGDGYQGWAEHAPYDAIVVTAAPPRVPEALVEQLALNGKMAIPVGTRYQEMTIITKTDAGIVEEKTIPVRFVPLVEGTP